MPLHVNVGTSFPLPAVSWCRHWQGYLEDEWSAGGGGGKKNPIKNWWKDEVMRHWENIVIHFTAPPRAPPQAVIFWQRGHHLRRASCCNPGSPEEHHMPIFVGSVVFERFVGTSYEERSISCVFVFRWDCLFFFSLEHLQSCIQPSSDIWAQSQLGLP